MNDIDVQFTQELAFVGREQRNAISGVTAEAHGPEVADPFLLALARTGIGREDEDLMPKAPELGAGSED
jgi:hypothetical protein